MEVILRWPTPWARPRFECSPLMFGSPRQCLKEGLNSRMSLYPGPSTPESSLAVWAHTPWDWDSFPLFSRALDGAPRLRHASCLNPASRLLMQSSAVGSSILVCLQERSCLTHPSKNVNTPTSVEMTAMTEHRPSPGCATSLNSFFNSICGM